MDFALPVLLKSTAQLTILLLLALLVTFILASSVTEVTTLPLELALLVPDKVTVLPMLPLLLALELLMTYTPALFAMEVTTLPEEVFVFLVHLKPIALLVATT
jgi:hypothetical protein